MVSLLILLADVLVFTLSALLGWLFRVGLEFGEQNFTSFAPYLYISIAVSLPVFFTLKTHKHFFRYFSLPEFWHTTAAVTLAVLITVATSFTFFRLDNVQRSLPLLQWIFALGGLTAIRLAGRLLWRSINSRRQKDTQPHHQREGILLLGFTAQAELCLRSIELLGNKQYFAAGILDENPHFLGRKLRHCEVIGAPSSTAGILARLAIHGVRIKKIILATDKQGLSGNSLGILERLEEAGMIELVEFADHLKILAQGPVSGEVIDLAKLTSLTPLPENLEDGIEARLGRYGKLKRAIDIIASLLLLTVALPVMALIAPLTWLTMGTPVIFWQERPGWKGRMFRLFKFRTLKDAVTADGRVLSEDDRKAWFGEFLRRTRLDELPQLYNVLKGDMSFIGPRPLLPVDLPDGMPQWVFMRNAVRPGLTGWAQINGGKSVGKKDKIVLDLWYLKNMSLKLDMIIAWQTIKVMAFGEKLDSGNIRKAYEDLGVPFENVIPLAVPRAV